MKEEEAARIASLNRMDLELFDSLTSHLSQEQHTCQEHYACQGHCTSQGCFAFQQ